MFYRYNPKRDQIECRGGPWDRWEESAYNAFAGMMPKEQYLREVVVTIAGNEILPYKE